MRLRFFPAFALVALLLVALSATGMAHRAPSAMMEQLRLMGADASDLCGMADMGATHADCPICRIDPGYLPPEPAAGPCLGAGALWQVAGLGGDLGLLVRDLPYANAARAPPFA